MDSNKEKRIIKALEVFKRKKVITMETLVEQMKCSERTIQRRLKKWGTYTSYNRNCRYYTLSDIPKFNQYGLWRFRDILFSKHGNLKETFIYIVNHSKAGMSAFEMSEIMGLPSYSFLSHFKNDPNIQREKHKGLYIYFSKDLNEFERQKHEREKLFQAKVELELPSDGDAIVILVELIKHQNDDVDQLTRRVRRRGVKISTEKVRNLLSYHGILKKKSSVLPQLKV